MAELTVITSLTNIDRQYRLTADRIEDRARQPGPRLQLVFGLCAFDPAHVRGRHLAGAARC